SAEPMADCILDERLENEAREQTVDGGVLDLVIDRQPIGESNSLNVEIRFDPDDLLAERDFIGLLRERRPEDRDELTKHAIRRGWCFVRELRHRPERIEQEVRLKLRLEVVESRAAQRDFESLAES